jgi:hypothetical protein
MHEFVRDRVTIQAAALVNSAHIEISAIAVRQK